ncbi:ParM/StbA family protein, partial [Leptospira santarosai]|nr:ParM/StbA family protein [Leptospira santarosai]
MKEKVFIAIDSGKYMTKGLLRSKNVDFITAFRTKMQEGEFTGLSEFEGTYAVEIDGKSFMIGNNVSEEYSNFDLTKTIDLHRVAILTAVVTLIKKANLDLDTAEMYLVINIPISSFNKESKEKYVSFITNSGRSNLISLDEKAYNINFKEVISVFEGVGTIYEEMEKMRDKHTVVVDIGGLNTTFCTFNGLAPVIDTMIANNSGINILKSRVGKYLSARFGISVSSDDLERIVQVGYLSKKGRIEVKSKEGIQLMKKIHFESIISFAKSNNYTFNNVDMVFVGGGSQILQDEIKSLFPEATIPVNPAFSNVNSFLNI